jgi:hypothetical protein
MPLHEAPGQMSRAVVSRHHARPHRARQGSDRKSPPLKVETGADMLAACALPSCTAPPLYRRAWRAARTRPVGQPHCCIWLTGASTLHPDRVSRGYCCRAISCRIWIVWQLSSCSASLRSSALDARSRLSRLDRSQSPSARSTWSEQYHDTSSPCLCTAPRQTCVGQPLPLPTNQGARHRSHNALPLSVCTSQALRLP